MKEYAYLLKNAKHGMLEISVQDDGVGIKL